MSSSKDLSERLKKSLTIAIVFVAVIWAVWLVDWIFPFDLNRLGILPRKLVGLRGIVFAPVLHANIFHLLSNTLPLFILTFTMSFFYHKVFTPAILLSILIGGILVWIFARNGSDARPMVHVGASGLIFSQVAFLISSGIFRKNIKAILIALAIGLLYGGLIFGLLPTRWHISWEGHLCGAIAGIGLAYLFSRDKYRDDDEK